MTAADIIAALELPASARVDQRVPKKLLLENGAPTAADKRLINEGIEALLWVAALKPTTIGVPIYRDEAREYLEIAVLHLTLRAGAKALRLTELIHRAIPYPVFLIAEQEGSLTLSAAHKRWSHGESGKTVLEDSVISAELGTTGGVTIWPAFLAALALARQSRVDLRALYQGWIDALLAWQAGLRTGQFLLPTTAAGAAARREALAECARLEAEVRRLRAAAAKERQISRRVELNATIQRLQADIGHHQKGLSGDAA
ncbi:MAG TPA: DUF4391 domain-containing protein [Acetobacteraceae bacterium]|nr:DUF4391 domain-containing protein [Acetobacteraceae bacterium]